MPGFASALEFTNVHAYDRDEIAELQSLKTGALNPPVTAFFTNIVRLKRLQQIPAELLALATAWEDTVRMATEADDDRDIVAAFKQLVLERYPSPDDSRTAEGGKASLRNLTDNTGDRLGLGLHAILSAQVIGAWTACEVLFGDLWEAALNWHPKQLATLEAEGNQKGDKQPRASLPLWVLDNNGFDVSKSMGTLLRGKVAFTSIGAAVDAYRRAFPDRAVNDAIGCDRLKHLAALRNVIVHKSGKADKEFCDAVSSHPVLATIAKDDGIKVTADVVQTTVAPAIEAVFELIHATDNWIAANP